MTTAIFFLLLVHGFGHLLGVVASFRPSRKDDWNINSWLLNVSFSDSSRRMIAAVVFILPAFAAISSALMLKGWILEDTDWRAVSLFAAFVSFGAIILFPKALFSPFNRTAAILLDIAIIIVMMKEPWAAITF